MNSTILVAQIGVSGAGVGEAIDRALIRVPLGAFLLSIGWLLLMAMIAQRQYRIVDLASFLVCVASLLAIARMLGVY